MDDASLRNTKGIHARITKIRRDLTSRFEDVVTAAVISSDDNNSDGGNKNPNEDRLATAIAQNQMAVSTGALIKAAEDLQSLIRQLQEIWLFGQLNTLGDDAIQQQTDKDAEAAARMIEQLLARHANQVSEPSS